MISGARGDRAPILRHQPQLRLDWLAGDVPLSQRTTRMPLCARNRAVLVPMIPAADDHDIARDGSTSSERTGSTRGAIGLCVVNRSRRG